MIIKIDPVKALGKVVTTKLAQLNSAYDTARRSPVNYTGANMAQPAWQALVAARDYAAFMRINARITAVNAAQNPGAVDAINW